MVINGAEDTLHAVTVSQTIQSELLEKNDKSDGIEEGISRSNGISVKGYEKMHCPHRLSIKRSNYLAYV